MTELHTDIATLAPDAKGCVVAIGNFDGVHLGHRALLAAAKNTAENLGAPLGVVTFEPHPRQVFQPETEPFRLTLPPMKRRLLNALGVAHLYALRFDKALSSLTAAEFIEDILVRRLGVKHVFVGADFAFGHKRGGTAETLKADGRFGVTALAPVKSPSGAVYSSTAARAALTAGDFAAAESILGWPWQVEAPVVHGDKRGRTLGMPTANQQTGDLLRIPYGVYAVRTLIEGEGTWRGGAANFGIRPMFEVRQPLFETFIFDFHSEIYGKMLRVQPVRHLRNEMTFSGRDALVAQMKEDCLAAKAVLKSSPTTS